MDKGLSASTSDSESFSYLSESDISEDFVPMKEKKRTKNQKTSSPRNFSQKQAKGYFWSLEENFRYRSYLLDHI